MRRAPTREFAGLRRAPVPALLINRSPRLQDLDTEAFTRLRTHPATNDHHGEWLFALQRAAAGLGYCDPPVRTGRSHMPIIEGAALLGGLGPDERLGVLVPDLDPVADVGLEGLDAAVVWRA